MLEQYIVDLSRDREPILDSTCVGCNALASKRLALPVTGERRRRVVVPACEDCESQFLRRRSCLVDCVLACLALLALLALLVGAIETLEGLEPDYEEPKSTRAFWWAAGFGASFLAGLWVSRVPTRPVVVSRVGNRHRYAFLDVEAGRRFAARNESVSP